ncbi:MAG: glycosyltransferase, partial [Candidatus Lokiarchaeota archaeon]|nr:glycosyltransferase [Candidatus Lokiarchaeota archaeon]
NILISDNASTDDTRSVCQRYSKNDSRISYFRQEKNLGAIGNFKFLLEKADSPYFMWAASDDLWHKEFINACIAGLEFSEDIGIAFSNIVNIDSYDRKIRDYPSFDRLVNSDPYLRILSFLLDPEYLGKANLFYGVFKQKNIKKYLLDYLSGIDGNEFGIDMALVLRILCDMNLYIDDRILFHKRYVSNNDTKSSVNFTEEVKRPYVSVLISEENFSSYKKAILAACQGTKFESFINYIIQYRENLNNQINEEFTMLKDRSYSPKKTLELLRKIKKYIIGLSK